MKLVQISDVKPNPKNPRVIKDGKFQKLVKSIQEFPDMLNKRPLIVFTDVDGKYCVLGGNMRLKALNELKFKEIPVIIADEWTEEQKAEFLIKDNVGFGEWDWDSLANEWDAEKLDDWGLDLPVDLSVQEEAVDVAKERANAKIRERREAELKKERAIFKALEEYKHRKKISDEEYQLRIDFIKKYGTKEWQKLIDIKAEIEKLEKEDRKYFDAELSKVKWVQFWCFLAAGWIAYFIVWGGKK